MKKVFRPAGSGGPIRDYARPARRLTRHPATEPKPASAETEDELLFAMDIGTRSVIGIAGRMREDILEVEAVAVEEHQKRAVIDGQIQDIRETAKIALKVKQQMEEKLGRSLTQVYIAAAGRVLKTGEAEQEADLLRDQEIDASFVAKLEYNAIQKVYEGLRGEEGQDGNDSFYCVGHSVLHYQLDNYEFSTLIGHKGEKASVRIIATFLPRAVVDSLNNTMARIGLTVAGLTLEPIAAINAVIPADLRRMNLALVDIGAGTADIAVCENGSVSAYTMATVAGDEITEAIMEECLADFSTAEELKRKLGDPRPMAFTNILGYASEIQGDVLYQRIMPAVANMVKVLGEKVSGINGRPPAAVFLVGGGSRLPDLCAMVAKELGMEENRIAVGGSANMMKQASAQEDIFGPEFATPLGIAVTAGRQDKDDTFHVLVNGERIAMPGAWEMSVQDALLLAGYKYGQIMGRTGKTLIYEIDGERRFKRGGLPGVALITHNGSPCALGDLIVPGDQVVFQPPAAGEDAVLSLEEAGGPQAPLTIRVNGVPYPAGRCTLVNGRMAEPASLIRSMDVLRQIEVTSIDELCRDLNINLDLYEIYVNDRKAAGDAGLEDGDLVETRIRLDNIGYEPEPQRFGTEESEEDEEGGEDLAGAYEEESGQNTFVPPVIYGKPLQVYLNGKALLLPAKEEGEAHYFVDMFSYVDIDTKNPRGALVQTVNGKEASYVLELAEGDEIFIHWDADGLPG